jgi:AraC-like DNA-binding protein
MSGSDFIHFSPFFLCVVAGFLHLLFEIDSKGRLIRTLINAISFSLFGFYLILANLRLISYSRTIKDNFSDIKKINLYWLRVLIFLLTLFLIFIAIFDLFFKTKSWDLIWLVSCIIIYIICYMGLIQPVIFSGPVLESGAGLVKTKKKYQKSSLSGEIADQYTNQLQLLMKEKKWFLDQNISLSDLAEKMGVSIHHLSQVLNEKLGLNFYDFINSLRIAEAKKRLTDPRTRHLSIASIGFAVGFNSLSAFNGAFKKFTNLTPSQYREQ